MKKYLIAAGGLLTALTAYKMYVVSQLKHFKIVEFGPSLPFLAVGLLYRLDNFREALGKPVAISKAAGSLIRFDIDSESQHVFGRAADIVLPEGPDIQTAYNVAKSCGFTGIGVYPDWYIPGLHLDIRPGNFAKWAGVKVNGKQEYVSIYQVINYA